MRLNRRFACFVVASAALLLDTGFGSVAVAETKHQVKVTLADGVAKTPITGRLYVFFSQRDRGEPKNGPNWFSPEPFYAAEVKDVAPGGSAVIDDSADGFPEEISKLKPGKYRVQALLDHDVYYPAPASGVGNFYSAVREVEIKDSAATIELTLDKVVEDRPLPVKDWIKPIAYKSKLLSEHFKRDFEDRAVVVLPQSYFDHPERRFPVVYEVSGFGGSLSGMVRGFMNAAPKAEEGQLDYIRVMLTGECKWGHHVYADSAINGPRGRVLTEELIPLIDREFRTVANEKARFVTGHSSGGWSSLWLQVTYPEVFGGVWSTAPDPVDFRDYQQSDLYANPPTSIYYFDNGEKKPLARRGTNPVIWYPDFAKMDDVLGKGGQLRSFEAVFSPLDEKGLPKKMWDRKTGKVDPVTADAWKAYDINLVVKNNWAKLGSKLAGKVHISMGELDTFYLNGATALIKKTFEDLKSDAQVEMVPGADHGSLMTPALRARQKREMQEAYSKYFDLEGRPK
jgi:hypothetical protein